MPDPVLLGGNFEAFSSSVFAGVLALAPVPDTLMVPPRGEGVCFTGLTFTWQPNPVFLPGLAFLALQESLNGGLRWLSIGGIMLPVPGTLDVGNGLPVVVSPTGAVQTSSLTLQYRLAARCTVAAPTRFTAACRGYSCL